jgi:hypothetical protein
MPQYIRVPPSEPTYKEILVPHDAELDAVELCRLVGEDGEATPSGASAGSPIYTITSLPGGLAGDAADTARTTNTVVLPGQHIGANGVALPSGTAADPVYVNTELVPDEADTARSAHTLVLPVQHIGTDGKTLPSGTATDPLVVTGGLAIDEADTGRTADTKVLSVQHVGADGHPLPSGNDAAGAIYVQGASSALGSVVALGVKESNAVGAADPPSGAGDGWAVTASTAAHVLDTLEIVAGPWHDAAHVPVVLASTLTVEIWLYRTGLWGCAGSYQMGNAAAIVANPTSVAGAISTPHLRTAARYYLRLADITVANHVTITADLSGGIPL